ncbi:MAG: ribosome maturation factor RimP [Selenomonadaceae bacterium]|nr:ribosome maturation factor RimP [Selenomonadaceae bacterium]MBR1579596.1 ribosome maturation factor RimP [Selenomonadaceae bacterium]
MGGIILSKAVAASVETLAQQLIDQMPDFELIDVEFVKEHEWCLRVFIDKKGGVDLDDCQMFSNKLGDVLDRENLIDVKYVLEVSSPGLDRVLKKPRDFVRERGKSVDVSFYAPVDGVKSLVGVLEGADDQFLKLEGRDPLPRNKIAQVRLHIDF